MRAQITGLETASKNANDGISLVQTAEGALTEVHSMLNRMVELAEQSANGTYQNEVDRDNLQLEVSSLSSEIDRISKGTNFNGINLLDGSLGKASGAPATMVALGSNMGTDAVVTKVSGASIKSNENVSISNAAGKISVTITDTTDSSAKTVVIDLAQAVTITSGSRAGQALGTNATDALKKGETATIDLSSVGLGKIDITASADTGIGNIGAGLTAITGLGTDPTGGVGHGLVLQIGDTNDDFNKLDVSIDSMSAKSLKIDTVNIETQNGASNAIKTIKDAINKVSSTRGNLGATQNRLEHTINNLGVTSENMTAAESRIRDVDMAKEMMNYTKNNILVQSSQAMLAQANQIPQGVLQLLK
jgi:flagellin